MRMPAVVVRDHRDRNVTELRLARQLRLLQGGPPDHVHAPPAIDVRFGPRGKLWPLHAQVGPATLSHNADFFARRVDYSREFSADRIGEGDVRHHSAAETSV